MCVCVCACVRACGGGEGRGAAITDRGLIPGLGKSNPGNPLQYSCLENAMDKGSWWATVHGSQSQAQVSMYTCLKSECYA